MLRNRMCFPSAHALSAKFHSVFPPRFHQDHYRRGWGITSLMPPLSAKARIRRHSPRRFGVQFGAQLLSSYAVKIHETRTGFFLHVELAFMPAQGRRNSVSQNRPTHKIFTARAASRATIISDTNDCSIVPSFAHRDNTAVSVGENAVLVLNARKR